MARYGKAFKDRAVARLLPPESASVESVSQALGVSVPTLERWRADRWLHLIVSVYGPQQHDCRP